MLRFAILAALTLAAPLSARAAALFDCSRWEGEPRIAHDRIDGKATRSYANGSITVGFLQQEQGYFLAVWTRFREDGIGGRNCHIVSADPSDGSAPVREGEPLMPFTSIDWEGQESAYDPARGLLLDFPATHVSPDFGGTAPDWRVEFDIRINPAEGTVVIERDERR